jgi:hypothetical protein
MTRNYEFDSNARSKEQHVDNEAWADVLTAWKEANRQREQIIDGADPKIRAILAQYGPADGMNGTITYSGPITAPPQQEIEGLIPEITGAEWSILVGFRNPVKVSLYFDRAPKEAQLDLAARMSQVPTIIVSWHKLSPPSKSNSDLLLKTLERETGFATR